MPKTNTTTKRSTAKKGQTAARSAGSKTRSNASGRSNSSTRANASGQSNGSARSGSSQMRSGAPVEDSKLKEFFIDELKDIYWAEQKLVKTLPKLSKAATSEELKSAFDNHLEETKNQVQRLEQAFKLLGEKAVAKKCDAMEGITEEGSSVIEDTDEGTATRDVGLVMAGQKAEHYEIATYGGLIQIAHTLGQEEVARLLEQTLEEEKNADQLLTEIAESGINYQASEEGEED
ncbi:MAG TPA: ferritin-like domain-containing protein [Puia sp.]|nr:ferritin-like domain-containing protein [Puia sp.]